MCVFFVRVLSSCVVVIGLIKCFFVVGMRFLSRVLVGSASPAELRVVAVAVGGCHNDLPASSYDVNKKISEKLAHLSADPWTHHGTTEHIFY